MDPYHRYADDPISMRSLKRLDYTPTQIAEIQKAEDFPNAGENPDYPSLRALWSMGYTKEQAVCIRAEIALLLSAYNNEILFGECRSAPCSAWRAERIQLGDEEHA